MVWISLGAWEQGHGPWDIGVEGMGLEGMGVGGHGSRGHGCGEHVGGGHGGIGGERDFPLGIYPVNEIQQCVSEMEEHAPGHS